MNSILQALAITFGVACFIVVVIAIALSWFAQPEKGDSGAEEAEAEADADADAAADSVKQALEPWRHGGFL